MKSNRHRAAFIGILVGLFGLSFAAAPAQAQRAVGVDPVLLVQAAPLSVSRVPQWAEVLSRHRSQIAGGDGAAAWQAAVARLGQVDAGRLLREVNSLVNGYRYVEDDRRRNNGDYWGTPVELFARGGDCEDFAIAKYLLLRQLGVPAASMRILVMGATRDLAEHAVLLVQTADGGMVLDNLRGTPYRYAQRTAAATVYAFNEEQLWLSLSNLVVATR